MSTSPPRGTHRARDDLMPEESCLQQVNLVGNQPLLLDDPASTWIVSSGSVAVFGVMLQQGVPVGRRRFLFLTLPGQPLFGVKTGERGLLAVAVRDSRLLRVPTDQIIARTNGPDAAGTLLETWLRHLGDVFDVGETTQLPVRLDDSGPVSFGEKDDVVIPWDGARWLRLTGGWLMPAAEEALRFDHVGGVLPLPPGAWADGEHGTSIDVMTTAEVLAYPDDVKAGLASLHERIFMWIGLQAEREAVEEQRRLRRRDRERQRLTKEALQELASVLDPRVTVPRRETPLLTAVACVGAALGIDVKAPLRAEDMSRVRDPVEAIARASGLRTRKVLLRGRWWIRDAGPLLAYVGDEGEERHPVALIHEVGTGYTIVDPDDGTPRRLDDARRDLLRAEATSFYAPLPQPVRTVGAMVLHAWKKHRRDVAFVVATGLAATLLGFVVPIAVGVIMDQALPGAHADLLMQMVMMLAATAFGVMAFNVVQGMILVRIGSASDTTLQAAVWDRLLRLPSRFFRRYDTGDLYQRVMSVTEIARGVKGATLKSAVTGLLAIFNFVLMFWFSPTLAMIAVAVGLSSIALTAWAGAAIRRRAAKIDELNGRFFGMVVQMVGGVTKIRIAGAEHRAFNHWVTRYSVQLKEILARGAVHDRLAAFNLLLPSICAAILFWVGAGIISGDGKGLSIGFFLAFNAAFAMWVRAVTEMSDSIAGALDTLALGRRLEPLLAEEPEVPENAGDPGRLRGNVSLEKVTFRYREDGPRILDEVDVTAAPGEFIALVGPSGSGKSTILRLLLGFESSGSGAVLYDGKDVGGLDVMAVRRQIGVVLQDGRLNAGSIYGNIACGAALTYDEAWEAAADAGLADEIRDMPMKMHTIVAEGGGNLSGGQRQRLLIARAIATHPRVILFDEATSALDNRTQALVSRALERRKVTRFVVAHRLSTIRKADRIYVLDRGRVVQTGTFSELARQKGLFQDLMRRQQA